jgi:hypothetical protein
MLADKIPGSRTARRVDSDQSETDLFSRQVAVATTTIQGHRRVDRLFQLGIDGRCTPEDA